MRNITGLALTFVVCLAITIVVAALFRVVGRKKPSLPHVVAIPSGITIAEAVRMGWHISGTVFVFVLTGAVGISVFCAQLINVQRGA